MASLARTVPDASTRACMPRRRSHRPTRLLAHCSDTPEPARELRASGMRWLGHLSYRLSDLQPRARRQVVDRNVEVDDQLVSSKLPAVAGVRNRRQHPAVHDRDLSERVRPSSRGVSTPMLPVVPREPVRRVEDAMLQDPSLLNGGSADDHLDTPASVIRSRGEPLSLELSKSTMVRNMLDEFRPRWA
jgi:hypothetical protein